MIRGSRESLDKPKPIEVTAHHEAGHVVVSWVLGIAVMSSRIFPDGGDVRGHTEHEDDGRRDAESLTRRAWVALAGPAAQEKYAPEWQLDGAEHDMNHASWCLASIPKDDGEDWTSDECSIREDRAAREARELVDEHWPAVQLVAKALQERRALLTPDLAEILGPPPAT